MFGAHQARELVRGSLPTLLANLATFCTYGAAVALSCLGAALLLQAALGAVARFYGVSLTFNKDHSVHYWESAT